MIYPNTAKENIVETHHPNCAMHNIITLVNSLSIHLLKSDETDKDSVTFEYTCGGCELLFYSPVPVLYTCHTTCFLMVWVLLLRLGIYNALRGYWNHVTMITSVALISIFLFGIESLAVQLEEPFFILTMQGFCNKIYDNAHEIIGWDPNKGEKNEVIVMVVTVDASNVDTVGGIML